MRQQLQIEILLNSYRRDSITATMLVPGGGGAFNFFFGWVCATRVSKSRV